MWGTCIAEEDMMARPDSIETFMLLMPMGFNPECAGDKKPSYSSNLRAAWMAHAIS
jgi:hypothetical protein